ncbi:hypothetical protein N7541_011980 [Penicillium brevicompactum]|uniref:DUF7514 domain-containing protein n=1 Tax=Penicillium brevicompactum TaxID=5074 RepID=A0A9W9QRE2_PENBR|nr:hypothetical protein N7541_011980 [Penicillium brevicompactum]
MSSAQNSWGTLINSDKSPAPLLEQLCLSIAQVMPTFDTNGTGDITPERMAAFYRKVGGNYDPLFLETKTQALSFIYQSLGCFHSLQPSANPYEPPTIPSLLPTGFVRWQTIQLLMDPDEHSVYLQNAVSQWDLVGANGDPLPKEIPRDAFPSEPDPEMLEWHEGISGPTIIISAEKILYPTRMIIFPRHRVALRQSSTVMQNLIGPVGIAITADIIVENTPPVSGHRKSKARTGFSTPRVSSPPPWGDRPHRPRGRDQAPGYGHPLSPGTADEPEVFEASSDEFPKSDERPKHHRHREKRHLSPPSNGHARRHSHDAYTRRPFRDLSPGPQRQRRSHESHSSRSSKSHPETSPRHKDRSRSRTAGVKFRDFIFGDSAAAPAAPSPPLYRFHSPPPRAVPRHLDPYAADDTRRGSYSGGSSGSRPSSGGSGSERQRSYSSAGMHRPNNGWSSPRTSAAKRYTPVPEEYVPSRRVPIYER